MNDRPQRLGLALAAIALVLAGAPAALAKEYWVDRGAANASDNNVGTAEAPFKTISAGVAKMRAGDTVVVKAGVYPEAVRIVAAGDPGMPVTLKAAPGERVVLAADDGKCGITWADDVAYVVIDGFEVRNGNVVGNEGGIGSDASGGSHVTVQNCVLIGCGVALHNQADCIIRRTVQTGCRKNGITLSGCERCQVVECEVSGNGADGVVVVWGSNDCKILRNTIHNHWNDSHPDAIQIYRLVTDLTVADNLLFNSGQGFMMQEADRGVFRNNMLVGTRHSGVVMGHKSTHNWTVDGNTIAYTSFKALIFSGKGTVIRNNILLAGADNKLVQQAGDEPCTSDYNLFWKPEGADIVHHVPKDQGEHSTFVADPGFRSAPPLGTQAVYYVDKWTDPQAPAKCTPATFCVGRKGMRDEFAVGDHVELNFDGVVRTVTAVSDDSVTYAPPLEKLHQHHWDVMVNWKDAEAFAWDLRPADDSPARGMGSQGRTVGSDIDIQAYMRGDFDGDGVRDLPTVHKEMPE